VGTDVVTEIRSNVSQ